MLISFGISCTQCCGPTHTRALRQRLKTLDELSFHCCRICRPVMHTLQCQCRAETCCLSAAATWLTSGTSLRV